MQIDVKEAARLLAVSEKSIYRWIKNGTLPGYRMSGQYRFNRSELLEWATSRRLNVHPDFFPETREEAPALAEAIRAGGIYYRVSGADKAEVLSSVVELMRLPEEVDRRYLLEVLLSRESLGSTGIGEGIAVPHVRNPIILFSPRPVLTLCFLEQAIDFASIDGEPVHTLFTLVSPTVRSHLGLLSRLAFALRQPDFRRAIAGQAARDQILAAAAVVDQSVRSPKEAR
jgi:PTS system nitrogen regulatory IIA component